MKKYIGIEVLLKNKKGNEIFRYAVFDSSCLLTKAFRFLSERGYVIKEVNARRLDKPQIVLEN